MAEQYQNALLAWEFDQIYPEPAPGEFDWYFRYARKAVGPILEYCCGSGRLLVPLAADLPGVQFDGVDSSLAMLNRLEVKAQYALGPGWNKQVKLHHNTIEDFIPSRRYGMAFLGLNSVHYLQTKSCVQGFFCMVHDAVLRPGGVFLIAVKEVPEPPFVGVELVSTLKDPVVHPITGTSVGRRLVAVEGKAGEYAIVKRTFEITRRDGSLRTLRFSTIFPIINKSEYFEMLDVAGFDTEMSLGYGLGHSDMMCFAATKAG